jgi:DMSO/TMAO reductase YedYZ molybdopterin-dependent catalytic subunit/thiosulfate reductase cytochrome b subunit
MISFGDFGLLAVGFPVWLRATHILNVLFLSLLMRSGLEILSAHPRLYTNDHCRPGSEWLRFTTKQQVAEPFWTGRDEEIPFPALIALPGGKSLGLGRHWHFLSVMLWILTGAVYIILLFSLDEWRRLVPTSWSVFPDAVRAARDYATFNLPPEGDPYNALQQLSYFAVIFLLAPLSIATGAAMSPAVSARFPWYTRIFGGRQAARSLHFLALVAFVLFTIGHTIMVIAHGLPHEWGLIVLGVESGDTKRALAVGSAGLMIIFIIHVVATYGSRRWPRRTQHLLQVNGPILRALFHHLTSREAYPREALSQDPWINGLPPNEAAYEDLVRDGFAHWSLDIGGLVEQPLTLSLDELRAMPSESQGTKHVCIQGWSSLAEWTGVPLRDILERCKPLPSARYAIFHALDDKALSEPQFGVGGHFYESIDLELARHPQTMLAYAMNGEPLPVAHGAPLRLRVETQLGFKMVKYLRAIEFVADYRALGDGQGGWREDVQHYSQEAGI